MHAAQTNRLRVARDRAIPEPSNAEKAAIRHSEMTHCRNGHLYDEANTKTDDKGFRRCRQCDKERAKRSRDKKREDRRNK